MELENEIHYVMDSCIKLEIKIKIFDMQFEGKELSHEQTTEYHKLNYDYQLALLQLDKLNRKRSQRFWFKWGTLTLLLFITMALCFYTLGEYIGDLNV